MIKACIMAGNHHQYQSWINENDLDPHEYMWLTEHSWPGVHGADLILVGEWWVHPLADRKDEIRSILRPEK